MKLTIFLLLSGALCHAQSPPHWETGGFLNGRYWTALALKDKRTFLAGYDEGFHFASSLHADSDQINHTWLPKHGIIDDTMKGLNRFYAQPENLRLPIVCGIKVFAMQVDGSPQADIDLVMTGFRSTANAAERQQKSPQQ